MGFPTTILAIITGAVSAAALFVSGSSIPRLRKYEDKAEKAAEWSNIAEERLWNTRYTVGAGIVAALISLLSALNLIFLAKSGWSVSQPIWAAILAFGTRYAAVYVHDFWAKKHKIPMMDSYNEAISEQKNVSGMLDMIAAGWLTIALLRLLTL
ncbi:hypothetical protein MCOR25_000221 [Pyricularia grisea]|uniref:Uncharacterized protein n=1 Tax=Pyricularia grisea TaxID=148305 RepID=A0A6P8BGH0_PYRGI|nr:uncharacterized protein PgNI_02288 [Pyricularia grisea]KAI6383301.1 hypothetical protein MCOR25_000221 [Pyricularia grisea]TLD15757.1 hypothetical protein PgNI_02288 [Pyricularia grisea]